MRYDGRPPSNIELSKNMKVIKVVIHGSKLKIIGLPDGPLNLPQKERDTRLDIIKNGENLTFILN